MHASALRTSMSSHRTPRPACRAHHVALRSDLLHLHKAVDHTHPLQCTPVGHPRHVRQPTQTVSRPQHPCAEGPASSECSCPATHLPFANSPSITYQKNPPCPKQPWTPSPREVSPTRRPNCLNMLPCPCLPTGPGPPPPPLLPKQPGNGLGWVQFLQLVMDHVD